MQEGFPSANNVVAEIGNARARAVESQLKAYRGEGIALSGRKLSAAQLEAKAQDFEAVFLSQMFEHMFDGVQMNPLTGDGLTEDTFRSMLLDEYAKVIASSGGIGIAEHVKRELLKLQEVNIHANH